MTFQPRKAPCTQCGDVVLISEERAAKLFGLDTRRKPKIHVQHADPGPDGEVFDGVDGACRRPRVVG